MVAPRPLQRSFAREMVHRSALTLKLLSRDATIRATRSRSSTLAFEGSPPNSNQRPVTPPGGRACVGYLAVVCRSDRPASIRSRMDGSRPKMTTPLIDNTVPITARTTHAPSSSPTATTSWPHPAATKPAYDHDMQYP
jgi:hypothetical protein